MMVDRVRRELQINHHNPDGWIPVIIPFGQVSLPVDTLIRLDEWARWARPRMNLDPHGQCASAEGNYESESDNERGIDAPPNIPVDLPAVLAVERVVTTRLPKLSRELIHRHFIKCQIPQAITRALGIHRAEYGNELKRAVLMVRNNLTREQHHA